MRTCRGCGVLGTYNKDAWYCSFPCRFAAQRRREGGDRRKVRCANCRILLPPGHAPKCDKECYPRWQADGQAPEYAVWTGIKMRCFNPNGTGYKYYGGRGITMCERWRRSFSDFRADVGPRPSPDHSLDRIDVNGHYEPGNVRWVTWDVQVKNKRPRRRTA